MLGNVVQYFCPCGTSSRKRWVLSGTFYKDILFPYTRLKDDIRFSHLHHPLYGSRKLITIRSSQNTVSGERKGQQVHDHHGNLPCLRLAGHTYTKKKQSKSKTSPHKTPPSRLGAMICLSQSVFSSHILALFLLLLFFWHKTRYSSHKLLNL